MGSNDGTSKLIVGILIVVGLLMIAFSFMSLANPLTEPTDRPPLIATPYPTIAQASKTPTMNTINPSPTAGIVVVTVAIGNDDTPPPLPPG